MDFLKLNYEFALGPVSPKLQLVPPHITDGNITLKMQLHKFNLGGENKQL